MKRNFVKKVSKKQKLIVGGSLSGLYDSVGRITWTKQDLPHGYTLVSHTASLSLWHPLRSFPVDIQSCSPRTSVRKSVSSCHGLLYYTVYDGGNAKLTHSAIWFRDPHSSHHTRRIIAFSYPVYYFVVKLP